MACTRERSDQIAALAAGRIAADGAADLLEHLARCAPCSAEFDLAADLVQARPRAVALRPRTWGWPLLAAAAVVVATWALWPRAQPRLRELAVVTAIAAPDTVLRGGDPRSDEQFARGMAAYRSGDFAAAAGELAAVTQRAPDDVLAQLYLGIARLQTGALLEAIAALRAAAEQGTGLVQERGLWFLANAHLLREQAGPARAALQQLRALDGDYAVNAAELLQALAGR
jgi:hypothetical protein